ncbi:MULTISPECIES: hypothetical protein [unclassified Kitasatospora]|uniref:hypothetical protein n=1 Tax=unclassified Kitasatospora TaxID=2633591 RepID=UPI00070F3871|nr:MULTISPECIES: hypothetical protein [unclassified Kitasatospora]KQV11418.1 hypothetical protein ASC99_35950 [Kitasatospora sp. Root107]KRB66956.1 hypothetical protein ASE03_30470 [Kitasatospora sp. Root187]
MASDVAAKTGGQLRFQTVASDERRSSSWTVFANSGTSDVYIAARPIAGQIKVSLHESGQWRHAFLNDAGAAGFLEPGADRAFDKFAPSGEQMAPGWTLGYTIVMPESELQTYPAEKKKITLLPAAGPDHGVAVMVLLAEASAPPVKWNAALTEVGRIRLANGGQVLLLSQSVPVPETWIPAMEQARAEAKQQAEDREVDLAETLPVVALLMAGEDGSRLTIEVSAWPFGSGSA